MTPAGTDDVPAWLLAPPGDAAAEAARARALLARPGVTVAVAALVLDLLARGEARLEDVFGTPGGPEGVTVRLRAVRRRAAQRRLADLGFWSWSPRARSALGGARAWEWDSVGSRPPACARCGAPGAAWVGPRRSPRCLCLGCFWARAAAGRRGGKGTAER